MALAWGKSITVYNDPYFYWQMLRVKVYNSYLLCADSLLVLHCDWLVVFQLHTAQVKRALHPENTHPLSLLQSPWDFDIGSLLECLSLDRPPQPVGEVSRHGSHLDSNDSLHYFFGSALLALQRMEPGDVPAHAKSGYLLDNDNGGSLSQLQCLLFVQRFR